MRFVCLAAAALATPVLAQPQVSIDLTGVQFRHQTNQSRSSAPNTISPAYRYTYAITGSVRGVGGALGLLYPTATPLATVLESLAPGSSQFLSGTFDNCSGSHPITPPPTTIAGSTVVAGINVDYAFTLTTSIDASNFASFSVTNVTLSPSILVGYLQFTTGSCVIQRVEMCPANCDGSTGSPVLTANDFQCFLNKFAGGDVSANCDCSSGSPVLTANDFQCFLNRFAAGCGR